MINYVLSLARHFKQSPPSHLLIAWNKDEAPCNVNHTAAPLGTCLHLKRQNKRVEISISLRYQLLKFWLQRAQALPERVLATTCLTQLALQQIAAHSSHKFPPMGLLSFQPTLSFLAGQVILAVSEDCSAFNEQHSTLCDPAAPQPHACGNAAWGTKPAACASAHTSHFWPASLPFSQQVHSELI